MRKSNTSSYPKRWKSPYIIFDNLNVAVWAAVFVVRKADTAAFAMTLHAELDSVTDEISVVPDFGFRYSHFVVTTKVDSDMSKDAGFALRKACLAAKENHNFIAAKCDFFSAAQFLKFNKSKAQILLKPLLHKANER